MAIPYTVRMHKTSIEGKKIVYSPKSTVYENVRSDDLAKIIEHSTSLTRGDVYNAITALVDAMTSQLLMGNSVTLDGFGTFSLQLKNKMGNGKLTPQEVNLDGTLGVIVRFRSANDLRELLESAKIVKYDKKNLLRDAKNNDDATD